MRDVLPSRIFFDGVVEIGDPSRYFSQAFRTGASRTVRVRILPKNRSLHVSSNTFVFLFRGLELHPPTF